MVIEFPAVAVRKARGDDAPELTDLVHEVWRETYAPTLPRALVQRHTRQQSARLVAANSSLRWVATLGPHLVAYCAVLGNCVDQFWVRAGYRLRGIGSALLGQALQALAGRGFQHAQAGCEDFNLAMRDFLYNRGWRLIGEETHAIGPGHVVTALVYSHELPRD